VSPDADGVARVSPVLSSTAVAPLSRAEPLTEVPRVASAAHRHRRSDTADLGATAAYSVDDFESDDAAEVPEDAPLNETREVNEEEEEEEGEEGEGDVDDDDGAAEVDEDADGRGDADTGLGDTQQYDSDFDD
jgi:hypothetical protein